MKKISILLVFVFLLSGCSKTSINNKIVPLYIDGQKENIILQKDENASVIVDNVGEMSGIQFYMPNPEGIEQSFTVFVYEFDTDYENSIKNGRCVALQSGKTSLQGATETVMFSKVKTGKYVIIIQAVSETLTMSKVSDKANNEIFLKNGAILDSGAIVCSVIFQQ